MQRKRLTITLVVIALLGSCAVIEDPDLSGMSFSAEPLLGKAVWHDLITEDIGAAKSFYGGLFGWTLEPSKTIDGRQYLLARQGNRYVAGLLSVAPRTDGQKISRWLPYVSVADVDVAAAATKASGGKIIVAPRELGFGRVAAIADPDGAVIGLARSKFGDPDNITTAPMAGAVIWNELLANDSQASAEFYERVFAYNAVATTRRGGPYTLLKAGGEDRAGILTKPGTNWNSEWLTFFGVADPAAAAARAEKLGGRVLLPVSDELRNGTMAIVTDPSGAVLVLQKLVY